MKLSKSSIAFLFFVTSALSNAQSLPLATFDQSSSDLKFESIENNVVRVIYPTFLKEQAPYYANLVEHYSHVVGLTYGIKQPEKFSLVIRGEMAEPNGFVTLAPRRSEWHTSNSFSTFVGSSEWFQTLSIHEYRHLNQMDHMRQNLVKGMMYLFGETGEQIGVGIGLHSWYLEGDAVWAETKYTDAGRGRSPEFLARLKGLILSNQLPTYDQFINGSYNNSLPNQYIYGYVLVSNATKKFGEDIWEKITTDITRFPHPLKLYQSFEKVTGQDFEAFYKETMDDLKKQWIVDQDANEKATEFREIAYPYFNGKDLYTLRNDLNSLWTVYKNEEAVIEIPFWRDLAQVDFSNNKMIYTTYVKDSRYDYKGSSDLFLVDLESKKTVSVTHGQRIYNPRFNFDGTKILAIEFERTKNLWSLSEFDLQGNRLRNVQFPDKYIVQASAINNDEVVAVVSENTGHKSLAKIHLNTGKLDYLINPSRNNISNVQVDKNKNIFFRAQYDGHVEIFKMDLNGNNTFQCTKSRLMTFEPFSTGSELYYSDMNGSGTVIKKLDPSTCSTFSKNNLVNFNYLGKGPSDNYNNFPLVSFDDQKEMHTKNLDKLKSEDFGDFSKELFIPHSWSFIGGNGYKASFSTDNYLRTMSISGELGSAGTTENVNYGKFSWAFKKWYPLFNLNIAVRDREVKQFHIEDKLKWNEQLYGVSALVPYRKTIGVLNYSLAFGATADYAKTKGHMLGSAYTSNDKRDLYLTSGIISGGVVKTAHARSIIAPWGIDFVVSYENANGKNNSMYNSYRFAQAVNATLPGVFANDGFMLAFNHQVQTQNNNAYRFFYSYALPTNYIFSRGYEYRDVKEFHKGSANYTFPISYPDLSLSKWLYLKRIIGNLYFDTTKIKSYSTEETLNSYGAELTFETFLVRKLPVSVGTRYIYKQKEKSNAGEIFTAFEI